MPKPRAEPTPGHVPCHTNNHASDGAAKLGGSAGCFDMAFDGGEIR